MAVLVRRKPEFDFRKMCVKFVVENVALVTVYFSVTLVFPCQCHSTNAPWSLFKYLPPTLHNNLEPFK